MPLAKTALDQVLSALNQTRPQSKQIKVARFEDSAFTLSFFDEALPQGHCVDEHFVAVQFALHERASVDAGIVGARYDDETSRYLVDYEVVEWDD